MRNIVGLSVALLFLTPLAGLLATIPAQVWLYEGFRTIIFFSAFKFCGVAIRKLGPMPGR